MVAASAMILLAASIWLGRDYIRGIRSNDRMTRQTMTALLASEGMIYALKDAESGQRGYLLTGDPAYLVPYNAARSVIEGDLHALELAAPADAGETSRVARLRELVATKIALVGLNVGLRQSGHADTALDVVRSGQGNWLMTAIRVQLDALQSARMARLIQARARVRFFRYWGMMLEGSTLACTLLGAAVLLQRRAGMRMSASLSPRLDRFTRAFGLAQGMMHDMDGRISFWSEGNQRLYGYTPEEALGRSSHELLHTGFPQPLEEIKAVLRREGRWMGDLVHRRRDGVAIHVASQWLLHREAGEADAVIEVNADISSLKAADAELRDRALRLRLALDASALGIWRWELAGDGRMELDTHCQTLFGIPAGAPVTYTAWAGAIPIEDRAMPEAGVARAIDPLEPNDEYACTYRIVRPDGTGLWVAVTGRAQFEAVPGMPAGRRVIRMLGTLRDVSEAWQAEQERQRTDALLRTIVETAPVLIYAKDRQGRMLLANRLLMETLGRTWLPAGDRALPDLDNSFAAEPDLSIDRRLMDMDLADKSEMIVGGADGLPRTWFTSKAPLRSGTGAVIGLVGVSVEITEGKRVEERLRRMVNELNHRVKNTLATVQSLVSQTLQDVDAATRQALDGRLLALAAIHDALTRENWAGVELDSMMGAILEQHDGLHGSRFKISGCSLRLAPGPAQALAIGLHELAVNAVRHGALSSAAGHVAIRWQVTGGPVPLLRLTWTEHGGPPVMPSGKRGFGVRLIQRCIRQGMDGSVTMDFDQPAGLVCVIEAGLAGVAAPDTILPFPQAGDDRADDGRADDDRADDGRAGGDEGRMAC